MAQCGVLLVVIGKGGLNARDHEGTRRLDKLDTHPDRFRAQTGQACHPSAGARRANIQADELPEDIRPLARRNAVRLTHEKF